MLLIPIPRIVKLTSLHPITSLVLLPALAINLVILAPRNLIIALTLTSLSLLMTMGPKLVNSRHNSPRHVKKSRPSMSNAQNFKLKWGRNREYFTCFNYNNEKKMIWLVRDAYRRLLEVVIKNVKGVRPT